MILRAIFSAGVLMAGYALVVSMSAAISVHGSQADPVADPAFPLDCPPIEGCRAPVDTLEAAIRLSYSNALDGCGLDGVDGRFDPTAHSFWKPRKLAEQDACLSIIAEKLGDWRNLAAGMRATRFRADGGVRLVPTNADTRTRIAGHLISTRMQTGLPQICSTLHTRARDESQGPIRMTAFLSVDGTTDSLTLRPVRR